MSQVQLKESTSVAQNTSVINFPRRHFYVHMGMAHTLHARTTTATSSEGRTASHSIAAVRGLRDSLGFEKVKKNCVGLLV